MLKSNTSFVQTLILLSFLIAYQLSATTINWVGVEDITYERNRLLSPYDRAKKDQFGLSSHYLDFTLVVSSMNILPRGYTGEIYIFNDIDHNGKFDNYNFQKITAIDETRSAFFGNAITHSRDTLFIAANSAHSEINKYTGAVYQLIDVDKDKNFAEETMVKITSSAFGTSYGKYGESIQANDNTLVIGAPKDGTAGTVYIIVDSELDGHFENNFQQKIIPSNYISQSQFGKSVAISNNTIVIGAPGYYDHPANYAGAIHILVDTDKDGIYSDETIQTITAPKSDYNDQFGISVAISENTIVIGADEFKNPARGAAYVINDSDRDGNYAEEDLVRLNLPPRSYTGRHVNISNSTIYVSSYRSVFIIRDTDNDGNFKNEDIKEIITTNDSNTSYGETSTSSSQLVVSLPAEDVKVEQSGAIVIYDMIGQFEEDVFENTTNVKVLVAKSNDNLPISYSLESYGDADLFTIDENTGQLNFKSPPNYENSLAYNNDDIYKLKVKASSTTSYALAELKITIKDVNEAPILNIPPNNQEIDEDSQYHFIIPQEVFIDEDEGDFLTYKATLDDGSELPHWLHFNNDNRTLSGVPENIDVGTSIIKITATDIANNESSTNFTLTVHNTNDSPVLSKTIDNQEVYEDTEYNYVVSVDTFIDQDKNDILTYKTTLDDDSELPLWLHFDADSQTFSGIPENSDVGILSIKITAMDTSQEEVNTNFTLTILNTNDNPKAIDDKASTNDSTNIIIQALINDSDEDGDIIYLMTASAVQGSVEITNSKSEISYTPKSGFIGNDIINYSITDNNGGSGQATVTVTVIATPIKGTDQNTEKSGGGAISSYYIYFYLLLALMSRINNRKVNKYD